MLIDAGRTLALRRQKGGYLASFVGPQSLFIDIMMNVGIILWAANATGDERLRQIALEHCRTTQQLPGAARRRHGPRRHLRRRTRASSCAQATHQGWRRRQHLDARPGLGDLRLHRGPSPQRRGGVPRHGPPLRRLLPAPRPGRDWCRRGTSTLPPDGPQLWDSSAGAITASGLWDLSEAGERRRPSRQRYRTAALTILQHALLRRVPGPRPARLGRHPAARRLSLSQGAGRR